MIVVKAHKRLPERATPSGETAGLCVQSCFVCGGTKGPTRIPDLFECITCGFISADINISDEALSTLYSEAYFHGQEYLDYRAEEECLRINFRHRLAILKALVPQWPTVDLFEIGCAYGFFLDEVRTEVRLASGIDISASAVAHAVDELGVDARQGDYLAFDLGRQVDVIALWDTIEHLKRPDLTIAKAARDLKPGGVLALTTGDIGSLNARVRGRRWRMIHPPTHLHYFSVATLSRLLDSQGFDVVHVSHPGNSRSLLSVLYFILALKMKRADLYKRLGAWRVPNVQLTVNLFDIMYVIATRRPDYL